jgi:hypothetical protein
VEVERDVPTIDPEASVKVQSELLNGENIYWAGVPNPGVIFHADDWYMIPFSLLWGGFSIFWESGVLGYWGQGPRNGNISIFMALWGIPFVVGGQYFIWGRFLYDAWLKRRTYYAVTNRRVLTVQEGWRRKSSATFLESIPTIEREGTEIGTLWFAPKLPAFAARGQKTSSVSHFKVGDVPTFVDIDDVDSVYRLIMELREKLGSGGPTTSSPFSFR